MDSPRDPLPADLSAEPAPAAPVSRPVPRPRDPGGSAEPLSVGTLAAGTLAPSDADLITASRAGDVAAYDTLYRRHVAAAHGLARQLVRGRAEADDVVAETFAKILDLLRRGGGPDGAFRPYLLTAVRRAAYDRHRAERRQLVTDEMETFDRGVPFADPAVADLERTMIARAFASLPERWQAVLWHTEIEGARPADVAPLLGLTANGVAALAYRAREGLRQAYLQMHLSGAVRDECRPVAAKLGAYVRGGLAKREAAVVAAHLDQCAECRRVFAELGDVNVALKGIVAPIVLGPAAVAYLASAAGKGSAGAWIAARLGWFRHAPKGQQAAAAGVAAAAVVGLAAAALALTGHSGPAPARHALPPAAAGAPAQGASSSSGPSSSASHHPGTGPSAPGSGGPGSAPRAPGPGAPGSASGAPGSVPGAPGPGPAAPGSAPAATSQPGQAPVPTEPASAPGSQPAAAAPAPSSAAPGNAPTGTSPASPFTAPTPAGPDCGPDQPGGHAVARRHRHRGVQRGQHGFRSRGDGDRERLAAPRGQPAGRGHPGPGRPAPVQPGRLDLCPRWRRRDLHPRAARRGRLDHQLPAGRGGGRRPARPAARHLGGRRRSPRNRTRHGRGHHRRVPGPVRRVRPVRRDHRRGPAGQRRRRLQRHRLGPAAHPAPLPGLSPRRHPGRSPR